MNPITLNGCRMLKHGVKSPTGTYTPCFYSLGQIYILPGNPVTREAITIYARRCKDLPRELGNVQNDSDTRMDFCENDRVRFWSGTPEFNLLLPLAKKL